MRILRAPVPFLLLPILVASCYGGSSGSGSPAPQDYNVITLAEIQATEATTAYQIVQQLRPRWMMRNRGQRTFNESGADYAQVVVDDMPPREFNFLRDLRRDTLLEIRYLDPREATLLYGTGHNEGVIKVTTRR